jgi:hypothetical protein
MAHTVRLHDVQGVAVLTGTDQHGSTWTQFTVDPFAGQEEGECSVCGQPLTEGWLCLDGGGEVCDQHVLILKGER